MKARLLRWATGCVAAAAAAMLVGALALSYADRHLLSPTQSGGGGWDFASVVEEITFIAIPAVGFVLATKRPQNKIGWIFLGAGLALGLGFLCQRYGQRGLVAVPGSLPASRAAAWFVNWAWEIPATGLAFTLLLFPTGRLASRRWRPAAWFLAAGSGLDVAAMVARACRVWTTPYTPPGRAWYPGTHAAVLVLESAGLLLGVAAVAVRFARSSGDERLQLKWFVTAAALVVAAIIPLALAPQLRLGLDVAAAAVATLKVVFSLALVSLFAAIAVAVLKYRLYDIDHVLSRTLAYAIVTGLLAAIYAGLVLLATQVLTLTSQVGVAAATLAAAALFNPLRRRVQLRVDRRFNRARYDADRMLADFAARLQDATDPEAVRADLMATIHAAVAPAHLSVWISRPRE